MADSKRTIEVRVCCLSVVAALVHELRAIRAEAFAERSTANGAARVTAVTEIIDRLGAVLTTMRDENEHTAHELRSILENEG